MFQTWGDGSLLTQPETLNGQSGWFFIGYNVVNITICFQ